MRSWQAPSSQLPLQQSESKEQFPPTSIQPQTPPRQRPVGATQTTPQLPQFEVSRLGSTQPKSPQTLPPHDWHVPPAQYPEQHWPWLAQVPPWSIHAGSLDRQVQESRSRVCPSGQSGVQVTPHWVVPLGQAQRPWFASVHMPPPGQQFWPQAICGDGQFAVEPPPPPPLVEPEPDPDELEEPEAVPEPLVV